MPALAPYAALLAVAGFGLIAPRLSRATRPALATWLLSVGAVISAASTVAVLAMMALPLIGRDDALMDYANISIRLLDKDTGSGVVVAAAALTLLVALLGRFCRQAVVEWRAVSAAGRLAESLRVSPGGLALLPDDDVDVFALGGRPGVVVATRGLVRCLSPEQRRAVLVHEHAHLRLHHHRHVAAVTLAACVNPLLWRLPTAGEFAVERWADELSAAATSRTTTAAALARVAAHGAAMTPRRLPARLAAASVGVAHRIAALQAGPPPLQPLWLCVAAALPLLALTAAGITAGHVLDVFTMATSRLLAHR